MPHGVKIMKLLMKEGFELTILMPRLEVIGKYLYVFRKIARDKTRDEFLEVVWLSSLDTPIKREKLVSKSCVTLCMVHPYQTWEISV